MTRLNDRTDPLARAWGCGAFLAMAVAGWGCTARPAGWEVAQSEAAETSEAGVDAEAVASDSASTGSAQAKIVPSVAVDWSKRAPACSPISEGDSAIVRCVSRGQDLLAEQTPPEAFGFDAPVPAPTAVQTVECTQDGQIDAPWVAARGPHITVYGLNQTAAHGESGQLALRFEALYDTLRARFEVASELEVDLFFSPDPASAASHDRQLRAAFPTERRAEGLYSRSQDEFVQLHPGWFLSQVFVGQAVASDQVVLPLLSTGLSEVFDQSGRDLHLAYAAQLVSGRVAHGAAVGEFSDDDLNGADRAASGSFLEYLVDRYGMHAVMNMVRASGLKCTADGCSSTTYGAVHAVGALQALVANLIQDVTGDDWEDVRTGWRSVVLDTLKAPVAPPATGDQTEIENLVRVADQAITANDAAQYRSTMEGFYCQTQGDRGRLAMARDVVSAFGSVSTRVVEILPAPTKSFRSARVVAVRRTDDGLGLVYYDLERFPEGWRFSGGSDW